MSLIKINGLVFESKGSMSVSSYRTPNKETTCTIESSQDFTVKDESGTSYKKMAGTHTLKFIDGVLQDLTVTAEIYKPTTNATQIFLASGALFAIILGYTLFLR